MGITAIAGILGTGAGGLLGGCFCRDSDRVTGILLAFAAGVMLSIVCFSMISDALWPQGSDHPMSALLVDLAIAAGFFLVWYLNDRVEALSSCRLMAAGMVMLLAIAIHNLPEGMIIGASTVSSVSSGFLLAILIGLHNIPEGMAVSVVLIHGGMNRFQAVLAAAASGIPTVIGAFVGWTLGSMGPVMLCIMLCLAAGAMLYVVMGELIPEALDIGSKALVACSMLVGILSGILVIFI